MSRQPRTTRRPGCRVALTERDRDLIRSLARLRVARTSDLVRLCFAGVRRDTAVGRLRRLFDGGYIAVSAREQASESIYSLGPEGHRFLRAMAEGDGGGVPRGSHDHHLAIVETWVALATMEVPGVSLRLARADWELRSELAKSDVSVVPDLFVVLDFTQGPVALAVEVDLGTEPLKVLKGKLAAYSRLALLGEGLFGWSEFAVAVAVGGKGRMPGMRNLLSSGWGGESLVWTLEEGPVRELTALTASGPAPLADPPCSKGRGETASRSLATLDHERDERL